MRAKFHHCSRCGGVKRSEAMPMCARCEWLAIVLKVGVAGAGAPILAEIFAQFEERILALEELCLNASVLKETR